MERIVIIDHVTHNLFVEDVDERIVDEKYNGNEQDYIEDNYLLSNNWSWDYITTAQYIPNKPETEVYEIDFNQIAELKNAERKE